jgi:hypothetical protein
MAASRTHFIARRMIDVVMAVLLVAGCLKAVDITVFAESLRTWRLLPHWAPLFIAPFIPAVEIGVGLAWFLGLRRRTAAWTAAAMLAGFTGLYGLHLLIGEPPDCGCLGLIQNFQSSIHESILVVSRNSVLLGLLAVAGWMLRTPAVVRASRTETANSIRAVS